MVLIHIARAGQILGRYPEADLPVLVGAGTVKASDHYWKKGMAGWLVVGTSAAARCKVRLARSRRGRGRMGVFLISVRPGLSRLK